ncbi:transcriptional regulator [Acinetobacter calcoaceticus]|uniref:transcriptional regulator n=1 Tax=Acinetobacter calcoaceticus TaxID=471 RepID=UPI00192C32CB|nr:winged helix-turn-helix domain-containing protein [Acinetobacter calcoaceticus]
MVQRITPRLNFDKVSRELSSNKLKNKTVLLGQAAAFCLDCLIAAQGEVVTQETLIEEGWRKHGFEVSTGNVRQVMSQLRRAFSQLEESPDLLITVHKIGYRLQISLPEQNLQPVATTETALVIPTQNETDSEAPKAPLVTVDPALTVKLRPSKNVKKLALMVGGILLLNTALAIAYFSMTQASALPQAHYQLYANQPVQDKKLLVDQRLIHKKESVAYSLGLLTRSPFWEKDRARYQWIYLNAAANPKIHSFFLCDRGISEPHVQCTSRVLMEE